MDITTKKPSEIKKDDETNLYSDSEELLEYDYFYYELTTTQLNDLDESNFSYESWEENLKNLQMVLSNKTLEVISFLLRCIKPDKKCYREIVYGNDPKEEVYTRAYPNDEKTIEKNVCFYTHSYIKEDDVREYYEITKGITKENLREHFNINEMINEKVFPIYEDSWDEFFFEEVCKVFFSIQRFYNNLAKNNSSVVIMRIDQIERNCIFDYSSRSYLYNDLLQKSFYLSYFFNSYVNNIFEINKAPKAEIFFAYRIGYTLLVCKDYKCDEFKLSENVYDSQNIIPLGHEFDVQVKDKILSLYNIEKNEFYVNHLAPEPSYYNRHHYDMYIIIVTKKLSMYPILSEILYPAFAMRYGYKHLDRKGFNNLINLYWASDRDNFIESNFRNFKYYFNDNNNSRGFIFPSLSIIIKLSDLTYENQECKANIAFIKETRVPLDIVFIDKIEFKTSNVRQIRKLLEINNKDQYLVVESRAYNTFDELCEIVGITTIDETDKENYEVLVELNGHMTWNLSCFGKPMIRYKHGNFCVSYKDSLNTDEFHRHFNKIFANGNVDNLSVILEEASKQKHGTTLIITDEAEKETNRLCSANRGIRITPREYKNEYIKSITSIDGAIVTDEIGNCYGIGAILDGDVIVHGNTARGARFNSAYNYIALKKKNKKNYIAVIISEDKTIDIISTDSDFKYIPKNKGNLIEVKNKIELSMRGQKKIKEKFHFPFEKADYDVIKLSKLEKEKLISKNLYDYIEFLERRGYRQELSEKELFPNTMRFTGKYRIKEEQFYIASCTYLMKIQIVLLGSLRKENDTELKEYDYLQLDMYFNFNNNEWINTENIINMM